MEGTEEWQNGFIAIRVASLLYPCRYFFFNFDEKFEEFF
jgi:hypothetical protein